MRHLSCNRWTMLLVVNVLFLGVLGFYQPGSAQTKTRREPFANSVRQRADILAELKQTNALLAEQNALLRSGKLKVVVSKQQPR